MVSLRDHIELLLEMNFHNMQQVLCKYKNCTSKHTSYSIKPLGLETDFEKFKYTDQFSSAQEEVDRIGESVVAFA